MKSIRIIGGGLAGLTLGIALRQREVPVTICEAGTYPRHRVCGEFISGRGIDVLKRFGLFDLLSSAGAREARTSAFFADGKLIGSHNLPEPALCISRRVLDMLLADEFVRFGGQLQTDTRVHPVVPSEGVVLATGRRAESIDDRGVRWMGVKMHCHGVQLRAELEMHAWPDKYIGFCQLAGGVVNVCGLFRSYGPFHDNCFDLNVPGGPPMTDSAKFVRGSADTCVIAGLHLDPLPIDPTVCRVGDALTMIPPITGNGMSMAFESAEIAVDPLTGFARGDYSWAESTRMIAERLEDTFSSRLAWAQRIHNVLFNDQGRKHVLPLVMRVSFGWRTAFALTRR